MLVDPVEEILACLIKAIVNSPELATVERIELADKIVYHVRTRPGEEGQIIGKNGTLGAAIRLVIKASAKKHNLSKYVYMDVLDANSHPF